MIEYSGEYHVNKVISGYLMSYGILKKEKNFIHNYLTKLFLK